MSKAILSQFLQIFLMIMALTWASDVKLDKYSNLNLMSYKMIEVVVQWAMGFIVIRGESGNWEDSYLYQDQSTNQPTPQVILRHWWFCITIEKDNFLYHLQLSTLNHNSGFHFFVVKLFAPDSLHQFSLASVNLKPMARLHW